MSVFASHTVPKFRLHVVLGLAAAFTAGALVLHDVPGQQTATIADALPTSTPEPTGTVFPEPTPIAWEGRILRTLAGGQGIEVKSVDAPGGYFFAYFTPGFTASASQAPLLIQGAWLGTTCEYGRCAPEVEVSSWESLPIKLE